jgi:hypothetical protein
MEHGHRVESAWGGMHGEKSKENCKKNAKINYDFMDILPKYIF